MTEIELNRSSHLIDPALAIWGWEIPVYLFLGGVTAGIMILSPLIFARTPREELSRWARLLPFAAPVLLSLGMLALFGDLAYKRHVLRFYAAFRWSSPMSWGSWILIGIYPATILLGLGALNDQQTVALLGSKPIVSSRLAGVVRWARDFARSHQRGVRTANVALGFGLGGYTGLLLGTLGARHLWSSAAIAPLFLVSGISTGAALMMLLPIAPKEHHLLRRVDLAAIGLEIVLIGVFLIGLATGGADSRAAAGLLLGGEYTATFWSLVIITGLAVPFGIEMLEARRSLRPTVWAPVLLLIGGLALRWILVSAGQA